MTEMLVPNDSSLAHQTTKENLSNFIKIAIDGKAESTKVKYSRALTEFLAWLVDSKYSNLSRASVKAYLEAIKAGSAYTMDKSGQITGSLNLRLSAIKSLANELADNGVISFEISQGISKIKNSDYKTKGSKIGNWLSINQAQSLLSSPDSNTSTGLRDRAILAVFLGCGLRRSEIVTLSIDHLKVLEGRLVIADLIGKGNKVRSIPVPTFVKLALNAWVDSAQIEEGLIFRRIHKSGALQIEGMSAQAVYYIVRKYAGNKIAPHDLRRSFAKLARKGGGDIAQLSLVLGHQSVLTTERYLGEELDLVNAPNDLIDLHLL
jgi:site-specific recombinase XerD